MLSHPFRRKKRNGWGTEVYSKSEDIPGTRSREKHCKEEKAIPLDGMAFFDV